MKFFIDENKEFLILKDYTEVEHNQLIYSFTKKVMNWGAIRKNNGKPKTFDVSFIDRFDRIPIGLWNELKKLCDKYNFSLHIQNIESLFDNEFNEDDFYDWALDYFKDSPKELRDYQIEGVAKCIKYKKCVEEISTSGGKTLMAFLLFRYLLEMGNIKKMLYIVPSIGLVTQTEEAFYKLEEEMEKSPKWKSVCIFGGKKNPNLDVDIVFGTWQSLIKYDAEFFKNFDSVFVDETHHSVSNSIKTILSKCYNAKYKIGMTGTLPEDNSVDSFTIQSYLGPCVYVVKSADLIAAKNATTINVVGISMSYIDQQTSKMLYELRTSPSDEKDGAKLLNLEKDFMRQNKKRFDYVCDVINKATKNSLILFSDIKNEYGKKMYDSLKLKAENKEYFYIDGSTPSETRDYYKNLIKTQENTHIIASIGVFSEGIDIDNLHNIFVVEDTKSEFIVRQILGRGMRLMSGKEFVTVIDFIDNYEYPGKNMYQRKNYLLRHANEREKIYFKRGFPYKRFSVNL